MADKKTKRDAPGSSSDMINKKVRSAHNSMTSSGNKGIDDNWSNITQRAETTQAIRQAFQEKINTPASDGTGTKRVGGKK